MDASARGAAADDAFERTDTVRLVTGTVTLQLPSGLYQVDVEGTRVTAHVGGGLGRNFVRLVQGDAVTLELMPNDPRRGRIVRKV